MKKAKIIQDGETQVVQLPREFGFECNEEVYLKKTGNIVHLIRCSDYWNVLFKSLGNFSDDFMEERVQPEVQKRANVKKIKLKT